MANMALFMTSANSGIKLFISYCWNRRKEDVRNLADYLAKEKQFDVWIDRDDLHGDTIEGMAEGIDNADVVVMLFSEEYKQSANCKNEAEYARQQGKIILPVRLHKEVTLKGWLGFILGARLWMDFKADATVASMGEILSQEILRLISENKRFIAIDAPQYLNCYQRKDMAQKRLLLEATKKLCLNATNGGSKILIFTGLEGIGKTCLISTLLLDKSNNEFFLKQCNRGCAIWVNFFSWRDELKFDDQARSECSNVVLDAVSRAARSDKGIGLEESLKLLANQSRQPLFIFDDVMHFSLLKFLHELCSSASPCIAITNSTCVATMQLSSTSWLDVVGGLVEIEPMSTVDITKMLATTYRLQERFNDETKIRDIANSCNGSPKLAVDYVNNLKASTKGGENKPGGLSDIKKAAIISTFVEQKKTGGETSEVTELRLLDVPKFDNYYTRNVEEESIRKGIRAAAQRPDGGIFVLSGGGGIGKSTLVAQLLRDPAGTIYFQRHCNIQIVVWLNCYKWRDGINGDEVAEQDFNRRLVEIGRQLDVTKDDKFFKSLDHVVQHFVEQRQRIFFILDDTFHYSLLDYLQRKCRTFIGLAITRDPSSVERINYSPFFKTDEVANPYIVGQLTDQRVVEIFQTDFKMKDRLNARQLGELARRSGGMPLLVSLIGAQFRNCKNYDKKFKELKTAKIGKLEVGNTGRGEKTAAQLFKAAFDPLDEALRRNYYAFLLFDPVVPVDLADLAYLWQSEDLDDARDDCSKFEVISLVRRVAPLPGETGGDEPYLIHQILHETAIEFCQKDFNFNEAASMKDLLSKLRLAIILARFGDDDRCDEVKLIEFVNETMRQRQSRLLESILAGIKPSSLQTLDPSMGAERCSADDLPKDSSNGQTVLMIAAKLGHLALLRLLMNYCPEGLSVVDGKGWSAFVHAVAAAQLNVVKFLVEKTGVEILFAKTKDGMVPLEVAAGYGHLELVKFIYEKAPETADIYDVYGLTAFIYASYCNKPEICKFFMNFERLTPQRTSVLFYQILMQISSVETIKIVYTKEAAADLNVRWGMTPIDKAADRGHLGVVKVICEKDPGAPFSTTKGEFSPLMSAARNGRLDVVKYFVENFPETLKVIDEKGENALKKAEEANQTAIIEFLKPFYN